MSTPINGEAQRRPVIDAVRDILDIYAALDTAERERDQLRSELYDLRSKRPDLPDGFTYQSGYHYGGEPSIVQSFRRANAIAKYPAGSSYSGLDAVIDHVVGQLESQRRQHQETEKKLIEANVALLSATEGEARLQASLAAANESTSTVHSALANEQGLTAQLRAQLAECRAWKRKPK